MRILLTGFGPFAHISENPSWILARKSGFPATELAVTFDAVETFLDSVDPESFEVLLMIGVAARSRVLRLERVGRNRIGPYPDASGSVREGEISVQGPHTLKSTLWRPDHVIKPGTRFSNHAGDYLCNYALYRALQTFPTKRVGFLHIPEFKTVKESRQAELLQDLIARIRA
jgi:pyrrolidone-carboxylate peptidase